MSDVLIVGAGSAGSILAERLSGDPACTVTVLEAGPGLGDPRVRALTADGLALPVGEGSPVARHYDAILTDHPSRAARIVRGACVGGSGAINGGYFCRGLPGDIEPLPGWSQPEIERHYRAVEDRIPVFAANFCSATMAFAGAAQRAGYPWAPVLSAGGAGVAPVPLNIAGGRRIGPGVAFLEPALRRPNLRVLPGTRVTAVRIIGGRVAGVSARGPNGAVEFAADRVVLSAGAIASAQALLLSGIGPAAQLRAVGVPVVADLPVGQRCWDHPEWLMVAPWPAVERRPVLEAVLVTPELEIRPYTTGFGAGRPAIGVVLTRPRSRGTVSLTSADPGTPPRIAYRYDSEPADLAALRHGRDVVRAIAEAGDPVWSTSQHLCGTAPMGADDHAVVDPRLRVRGVDNLWVVDGSVLPAPLGRGPHATIAMLAHRAAEFLTPRST